MFFTYEKGFKHKRKCARRQKEFVLVGCFYLEKGVQTIIKCFVFKRKRKQVLVLLHAKMQKKKKAIKGNYLVLSLMLSCMDCNLRSNSNRYLDRVERILREHDKGSQPRSMSISNRYLR